MNDVCSVLIESQRIFKIDSYRRIKYEIAVNRVLAWEIEIIVPCHGDVIRGEELCRNVLTKHFLA